MPAWEPVKVYNGQRDHYQCPRCKEVFKCATQLCPSCGLDMTYRPKQRAERGGVTHGIHR